MLTNGKYTTIRTRDGILSALFVEQIELRGQEVPAGGSPAKFKQGPDYRQPGLIPTPQLVVNYIYELD